MHKFSPPVLCLHFPFMNQLDLYLLLYWPWEPQKTRAHSEKLWEMVIYWPGWCPSLLSFGPLGVPCQGCSEVCDAIWHQTKQGFGLDIIFLYMHSQFKNISKWPETEKVSSLISCSTNVESVCASGLRGRYADVFASISLIEESCSL